jgi:HEAT repeat protein
MFEIADRLGMDRAPRIVCSDEVHMPFAAGLLSPTIVLPAECTAWDAERRSAVLMHELAHIKRRDLMGHTLGRVACALYWFHPLVWSAARRLRIESERACDDLALTCGLRATNYAEHLLDIVTSVRRPMTPAVAIPMADRREFEGRMLAILDPDVRRRAGRGQSLALVGGLLAMAVVVGGAVPAQVAARAPDPTAVAGSADSMVASSERDVPDEDSSIGRDEQYVRSIDSRVDRVMRSTVTSQKTSNRISGEANVDIEDDPSSGARSSAATLALDARLQSQGIDDRATMLITVLRTDSSAELRRVAAWGLRQYAERPEVSRALAEALRRDGETTVREMCAWALGDGRGDETATAALIEALGRDRDPGVRESAAWALGSVGAETAGDALATAVRDASPRLRSTALWALGNLDHGAVPSAVIEALADSSAQVRRLAAWVLYSREDAASVPAIERALARESDRAVRGALIRALGAMGEPASPALARLLDSSDADLRAAVVNALAGKGGGPWPLPMPRPRPFP